MIPYVMEANKEYRPLAQLRNWENNPRTITKDGLERLKRQIQKHGQYKPLIITQDGTVLGGNMRLRAMREMGIKEAWVSVVEADTEEKKIEIALSDNDRVGRYDEDALANLTGNFPEIEWGDYSVDLKDPVNLQDLIDKFTPVEEDEAPEVEQGEAVSKLGEVYQLGRHRLMCGDSTKIEDVEKLMDGKKADMVFTDPPYNVDYTGKTAEAMKIENDKFDDGEKFYDFLYNAFSNLSAVMKSGAAIYVCHAESEGYNFRKAFVNAGFDLKQCIIWNKNSMVMGRQDYQWKHEPILYGWKSGASHVFYGGRNKTTVWDISRPSRSSDHPTTKPLALISEALKNSSKGGDIVTDLFCGSGSTLIACEQSERACFSMELDPHYCDVIRKRYAKFIGKEDEWQELTSPDQSQK